MIILPDLHSEARIFPDVVTDFLKLWGDCGPRRLPLPDLRFTSGFEDETRSQCLGDNRVFDERPPSYGWGGGRGPWRGRAAPEFLLQELGAGARAGSPAGHQHAGAASAVLEGLPG